MGVLARLVGWGQDGEGAKAAAEDDHDGSTVPFSASLPDVTSATPSRAFQSDSYFALFVKNAKSWGERAVQPPIITYPYTFVVMESRRRMPVLFVTFEESIFGTTCLGVFGRGGGHGNLGDAGDLRGNDQAFIDRAVEIAQAEIGQRLHELSPK